MQSISFKLVNVIVLALLGLSRCHLNNQNLVFDSYISLIQNNLGCPRMALIERWLYYYCGRKVRFKVRVSASRFYFFI